MAAYNTIDEFKTFLDNIIDNDEVEFSNDFYYDYCEKNIDLIFEEIKYQDRRKDPIVEIIKARLENKKYLTEEHTVFNHAVAEQLRLADNDIEELRVRQKRNYKQYSKLEYKGMQAIRTLLKQKTTIEKGMYKEYLEDFTRQRGTDRVTRQSGKRVLRSSVRGDRFA